jgi:membrane protein DedA with SNARE-associated domain
VLDAFLDWLTRLPALPTYLVLMALSALENVFPPVPADVAVVLGAFLARRGDVSVVPLGVLCWLANTASSIAMYRFARSHGAEFFRQGWGSKLMPPAVMRALEEAYRRYGVAGIFVSRFLPGVRAAVTPFAGVVGMPPARALVPAALASAIWYAFLSAAGYTIAHNWDAAKVLLGDANRVLGIAAIVAVLGAAVWIWISMRRGDPPLPPE